MTDNKVCKDMTDNKVCKGMTDFDHIVPEKKPCTDVNPKEKLPNKANEIERESKNLNKYLDAHQNNLSSNNETIYLHVELSSNHTEVEVCKDMTDIDHIVTEKKPCTDVNPKEKLPNKANEIEREAKNLSKYLEAHQNNLSSNNETIYLDVELPPNHTEVESFRPISSNSKGVKNITSTETIATRISSAESVDDSKKYSYCCNTLSESGIAAAKFSIFISIVLLLISALKFFKSSEEEDNTTKMLAFFVGVYAMCYLHCARKLIYGIEKEMRDKFFAWVGFSIVSIFLLFSGAIYVVIYSWDELEEIRKEPIAGGHVIALAVLLVLIACALIYCIRIVLLVWKSLNIEEISPRNGSHDNFICHFCNYFNSFSRAVSSY